VLRMDVLFLTRRPSNETRQQPTHAPHGISDVADVPTKLDVWKLAAPRHRFGLSH
jgi:hypothetical protein